MNKELSLHIFTLGFAGVDFFFVLSGFIIAYTAYSYIGKKTETAGFLRKRFIRIYPVYWIYLLVSIAGTLLFRHDFSVLKNIWKTMLLLPGHRMFISTSWTLTYELVFYLLFAAIIFSRWSLIIIVPIIIISIYNATMQNLGYDTFFTSRFFNVICSPFNCEFLLGFFAYAIYKRINKTTIYFFAVIVVLLALVEILFLKESFYADINQGIRIIYFGMPAFAVVTVLAALDYNNMVRIPTPLVQLGDASYTLYLIHPIIFHGIHSGILMQYKMSDNEIELVLMSAVLLSIFTSILLYKFVEKPLLDKMMKLGINRSASVI